MRRNGNPHAKLDRNVVKVDPVPMSKAWKQPVARWPMAGSGVVVFLALFLPAGDGCNSSPMVPVEHVAAWPPCLLGAMVAGILLQPRAAEGLVYAIRLLTWLVVGIAAVVMLPLQQAPTYERAAPIFVGTAIVATIGVGSLSEMTLSRTVIGAALAALAWFLVQVAYPGESSALGAIIGVVGAIGLFACGITWLREAFKIRAEELAKR